MNFGDANVPKVMLQLTHVRPSGPGSGNCSPISAAAARGPESFKDPSIDSFINLRPMSLNFVNKKLLLQFFFRAGCMSPR
jgi:hypothetical protein